jgi:hypothetical protein
MMQRQHAVLIHGLHLLANGWDNIVWGDPEEGIYGRVPRGVAVALERHAELVVVGTGASWHNGLSEAGHARQLMVDHGATLAALHGLTEHDFLSWVDRVVEVHESTTTTTEEVQDFFDVLIGKGITCATLVSSPTHLPRCMVEALSLCERSEYQHLRQGLSGVASDVSYIGFTPEDLVVIEPPHRGDNAPVLFGPTARRMFRLLQSEDSARAYLTDWKELLERYGV